MDEHQRRAAVGGFEKVDAVAFRAAISEVQMDWLCRARMSAERRSQPAMISRCQPRQRHCLRPENHRSPPCWLMPRQSGASNGVVMLSLRLRRRTLTRFHFTKTMFYALNDPLSRHETTGECTSGIRSGAGAGDACPSSTSSIQATFRRSICLMCWRTDRRGRRPGERLADAMLRSRPNPRQGADERPPAIGPARRMPVPIKDLTMSRGV